MPRLGERIPPEQRLLRRLIRDEMTGCLIWTGSRDQHDYGKISDEQGRMVKTHRLAYSLWVGDPGPELHHTCNNRPCCEPTHLQPTSHIENCRASGRAQRTHCKRGHEYTPENTYRRANGIRECRECIRIYNGATYRRGPYKNRR